MNDSEALSAPKRINYHKRAFAHYDPVCARCGYGVPNALEHRR